MTSLACLRLMNQLSFKHSSRRHLLTMLDAVYVDAKGEKRIVAVKPKPAFRPIFQVATTREGSGIELLTSEPPEEVTAPEARPCFWWRRGRVSLYLKHGVALRIFGVASLGTAPTLCLVPA